ncbi:MAG: D-2-hydroxyacid dehydrogenase, partial [Rhodospirillales bacterium]|nr:D-2-hydroxyacid dehydrogenase [Rhodospirillales bacterium]
MIHIALWSPHDDYLADLLRGLEDVRFTRLHSADDLAATLPTLDALVMLGHFYTAPVADLIRGQGERLRWIQLTTAGYDGISFHGVPAHVRVTNAGRSHAPMVAEHAVTLLTALVRRLPAFAAPQARHTFDRDIGLPLATLEDATVAILGYGAIGRETARRVAAFGPRVIGIARSARTDDIAAAVRPAAALHEVLAEADALVVTAALTAETRGMVDAAALRAMKPHGVLVNVARGAIVDSAALVAALRDGHLAGAGLDLTDPEPPPPDDP